MTIAKKNISVVHQCNSWCDDKNSKNSVEKLKNNDCLVGTGLCNRRKISLKVL